MFKLIDVFWAYILIAILILVGRFVRQRLWLLRSLYIPSSVVAGIIALLLGSGAFGAVVKAINPESPLVIDGLLCCLQSYNVKFSFTRLQPKRSRLEQNLSG